MNALVDNDIVIKASCYGLASHLLPPVCGSLEEVGVLGAVRYVAIHRIKKMPLNGGHDGALQHLELFLQLVETVEPTDNEENMAADIEFAAQRAGVSLDVGESHLYALSISRQISKIVTGDKRAIVALESILDSLHYLAPLCGRVLCLEQVVRAAINQTSAKTIFSSIRQQPVVDAALKNCAGCDDRTTESSITECLDSYIEDVRMRAIRVLYS